MHILYRAPALLFGTVRARDPRQNTARVEELSCSAGRQVLVADEGWIEIGHRPLPLYPDPHRIGDGEFGWDVGLMNRWVLTRLFWDPTQDVDSLYRYYIQRTYREAAPQMLAYYELIKSSWLAPDR